MDFKQHSLKFWEDYEKMTSSFFVNEQFDKDLFLSHIKNFTEQIYKARKGLLNDPTNQNKELSWADSGLDCSPLMIDSFISYGLGKGVTIKDIQDALYKEDDYEYEYVNKVDSDLNINHENLPTEKPESLPEETNERMVDKPEPLPEETNECMVDKPGPLPEESNERIEHPVYNKEVKEVKDVSCRPDELSEFREMIDIFKKMGFSDNFIKKVLTVEYDESSPDFKWYIKNYTITNNTEVSKGYFSFENFKFIILFFIGYFFMKMLLVFMFNVRKRFYR
jgi:hypothetical protein